MKRTNNFEQYCKSHEEDFGDLKEMPSVRKKALKRRYDAEKKNIRDKPKIVVKHRYEIKSEDTWNLSRELRHTCIFKKDNLVIKHIDEPDGDESPGLDYIEIKYGEKKVFEAYNYRVSGYIPGEWEKQLNSYFRQAQKHEKKRLEELVKKGEEKRKTEQKEALSKWGL